MEISERLYIVMGSIEFCVNAALLSPRLSADKKLHESILRETSPIFCVCFALRRASTPVLVRSDRYLSSG